MSEIITFAPTTAGGGNEFVVPFPYLLQSHVKLYVNGVEDTGKTWPSDGMVRASVTITAGDIVVVKRETPRAALLTTLPDTGALSSDDMNEQSLQAVYVATEAADGLREGLALDEATESYWEGAPTGSNRILKNVIDPSAAQEAATKGWYDTQLSTHASNAATSASNASDSADAAAASASSASSSATAAAASAAEAVASDATLDGIKTDWAAAAEAWAITAEDVLVTTTDTTADGVDDYSAYHWAQKADQANTDATAANAIAQAAAAAATPTLSSVLLGEEPGLAINYLGDNISSNDFSGTKNKWRDLGLAYFSESIHGTPMLGGNDHARFNGRKFQERASEFRTTSYNEANGRPIGFYLTGADQPHVNWGAQPGNGLFGGQGTVGLTDSASTAYGPGVAVVNSRNPTRLLIDSSTGLHYCWSNVGFNSARDPIAGYRYALTIVVGDANNYGDWPDLKVEHYHDGDNVTYSAQIHLDTETVSDVTNFTGYRKTEMFPGLGWIRYDFFVPAGATDATYNLSTLRCYMCEPDGTTNFTGDGTSNSVIGWFGMNRGWHRMPLHDAVQSSLGGTSSFGIGSPTTHYDGFTNTLNGSSYEQHHYQTFWGHMYLHHQDVWDNNNKVLSGYNGYTSTRGCYMYRKSSTGNMHFYINVGAGPPAEDWDTGLNIPISDLDNNGLGTKLAYVWTINYPTVRAWIRLNDGAITEASTTYDISQDEWATGGSGYQGNTLYTHSTLGSGAFLKYKGFIARSIGTDAEVERLMYF